jgi:L-arabinose transport system substrate-binding protein
MHGRSLRTATLWTVLALVGTGAVAGQSPGTEEPGTSGPVEAPTLAAIQRGATDQYFIDLQAGFRARVEELGGVALLYDAKEDPNLAISLVQDAISAGARGIATTLAQQTTGPAIAKIARDAGVALVATDNSFMDDLGQSVPFVGFDGRDMGMSVGTDAVRLLTEAGWLDEPAMKVGVLSMEVTGLSVCKDRTDAASEQMIAAGVPADSVYVVSIGSPTTIDAQDAAGPVITAHPDVTHWVVYGCNDEGVLGALNAMGTQGIDPANVIAVGLGAYEACKSWNAGLDIGFRSALFISGVDVGSTAAQILWDNIVNGQPLPAVTIAPTSMVGPTTWAEHFECTE